MYISNVQVGGDLSIYVIVYGRDRIFCFRHLGRLTPLHAPQMLYAFF